MSEEEKKAIEDLKKMCIEVLRDDDLTSYDKCSPSEKMTLVDIVLNLIEKQQKELEQEKEKNKRIKDGTLIVGRRNGKSQEFNAILEEYISKDKIRELIKKEAYTGTYNFKTIEISKIEELLEE